MNKIKVLVASVLLAVALSVASARSSFQVVGTGATEADACDTARYAARAICFNYVTLSTSSSESGGTWTCLMLIACPNK